MKSSSTDTIFKAFGKVSKWISSGVIEKGTCVNINYEEIDNEPCLLVRTYSETGLSEQQENVDVLGIALNNTTGSGQEVYVCQEGITTVRINNSGGIAIKCSSYGVISSIKSKYRKSSGFRS